MEIIPAPRTTRFEQLNAGELFIFLSEPQPTYALKMKPFVDDEKNAMVLLGPSFIQDVAESRIVSWRAATVLSFGKNFSILPSLDPAAWSTTGPSRIPVCLAVAGENAYVCTNGGPSSERYFPCFVDVKTGAIFEVLPGQAAFTNSWEIAVLTANHPPRSILKFPLA